MDTIVRYRTPIRIALIFMAISLGVVAAWILIAPKGFYDSFPGGGTHWVSALPPYNEHLERDFGATGLGLAVLAALAGFWMERRLVQATAIALLVAGLPHLAYHLTTTEHYSTGDNFASLGGLALQAFLPLLVLYLATRPEATTLPSDQRKET